MYFLYVCTYLYVGLSCYSKTLYWKALSLEVRFHVHASELVALVKY